MSEITPVSVDSFIQKNITIGGLEIIDWTVYEKNPAAIYQKPGQNNNPFVIPIPYNANTIESKNQFKLVLCLQSPAQINRVCAKATLERKNPPTIEMKVPIQLVDDSGAQQIPFPPKPDGPMNYYHRWWNWPNLSPWREPDDYVLKIKLGYNQYNPAPVTPNDWTSNPIIYNIKIKKNDPPKTGKK